MNSFFMILRLTIIVAAFNIEGVLQAQTLPPETLSPAIVAVQPAPLAQSSPGVIISSPVANQRLEIDKPTIVIATAVDPQGVMRVELMVNGQLVSIDQNILPQPNQAFTANLPWLPEALGSHTLQVRSYNRAGTSGQSDQVLVQVVAPTATPLPTNMPTPTATPTPALPYAIITSGALRARQGPSTQYEQLGVLLKGQTVSITGRNDIGAGNWWQINFPPGTQGLGWISGSSNYVTAYNTQNVPIVAPPPLPTPTASPPPPPTPTATPSPLPTSIPTPKSSPVPPSPNIQFWADSSSIRRGECVGIHWNVTGVRAVYYNDKGVPGPRQKRRECPTEDAIYTLRVEKVDGSVDIRSLQIDVSD